MGDNLVTCANENCAHAKCTPVLDEIITKYAWARHYSCTQCRQQTYICIECAKTSQHRLFRTTLSRHHNYYHRKVNCDQTVKKSTKRCRLVVGHPRQITTIEKITSISNGYTEKKSKEITTDDISSLTSNCNDRIFNEVPKFIYDTEKSFTYFSKNTHRENRKGPAYLVGQALCNSKSAYKHISTDDVNLHILLAKFTFL